MTDKQVIQLFVEYLEKAKEPGLKIDSFPDEANRNTQDIDALAGGYAIEHTSVDTLPEQRKHTAWFMNAVGELEQEFSDELPFLLMITIEYFDVKKGQNWRKIRDELKKWILNDSMKLSFGNHRVTNIPGVPFTLMIKKLRDSRPGIRFSRYSIDDKTLPNRLRELIERKSEKLRPYKEKGYKTILILESDDIALMNEQKMYEAIKAAFPYTTFNEVDEIWFADSTDPTDLHFLKIEQ